MPSKKEIKKSQKQLRENASPSTDQPMCASREATEYQTDLVFLLTALKNNNRDLRLMQ